MSDSGEDYEDDYEDDFEDELSTHSRPSPASVPATQTSNTSQCTPSTAVAPARGPLAGLTPAQNQRTSLETSYESYQSSGDAGVFASHAREQSTSSSPASSRHSDPMYSTEAPAAVPSPHSNTPPHAAQAAPHPRSGSATSSSSSDTDGSDDSESERRPPAQLLPLQQQPLPFPGSHLSVPSSSVSLGCAAGQFSGGDTPASLQGTTGGAAMVAAPNIRDVSGPRQASPEEGSDRKKKAIHQSNYTTVEELDDEPLPQHRGRTPTVEDEELSDVEDETKRGKTKYQLSSRESMKQEAPAAVSQRLQSPPLHQRSPTQPSSRSSSPATSEAYSESFTGATPNQSSARHSQRTPTPARSKASSVSAPSASRPSPKPVNSSRSSSAHV